MVTLRDLRYFKQEMSQRELAEKIGVSKSTINAWEKDISVISGTNLKKVANYFNVSTDEILGIKKGARK